jgi:RNA-directed DNA polymerase
MSQSAPGQLTRQQIYDRIRQSSKDEYILEEMVRLGFWPKEEDLPNIPAAVITRQGELERELRGLMAEHRMVEDPEQALKQMRKQRMADSRRKRQENKIKRIKAAHAKAVAWHRRRRKEILYVGPAYSKGLQGAAGQPEKLARHQLPDLPDALSLATAMGISLSELRFLTFARPTATVSHYQRFEISKKTGGSRVISAPMPRLKRAQYWILDNLLNKIPLPDTAHGFVASRSILTNAAPHVGAKVVINMDLKDFFPTITYARIKGLFISLGYAEQVATLLALLCSEPEKDEVRLDGKAYFVASGPRVLPQGAPTSPAISNILSCRMDRRLRGTAAKLGYTYTRYADDLTFSSGSETNGHLQKLLWRTRQITTAEGFTLNESKTRIMHSGRRQEVTGIVVNEKLSVDRRTLKRFRALLFQIEKDGPKGKSWGKGGPVFEAIQGYANFIHMVDPAKGRRYLDQVRRILKKYKYRSPEHKTRPLNKFRFRKKAAAGKPPRDDWWQAVEKPPPELILPKEPEPEVKAAEAQPAPPPPRQRSRWRSLTGKILKHAAAILLILVGFRISPALGIIIAIVIYMTRRR